MLTIRVRLRDVLHSKQISQRQLAELTGFRPATINSLCRDNVSRIYLHTLATICNVLQVEIGEVLVIEQSNG
ncbi:helix-turn-helix transcriptional regulator [Paenibacillus sp. HWE-109]|uniref:helix-turn-helix domain-containing protein n=1 Tax=Paenibacillus sp. HWE-109 TaxID=1306526 RepID=UPI001EDCF4C3|nr:helix-turn-helix transcriptional regulator [Paenibacillus sp. HWE-109]UKS27378.1 helix-turn-helix transcriptional regulator [Paenibacillus sp. HWE-109]